MFSASISYNKCTKYKLNLKKWNWIGSQDSENKKVKTAFGHRALSEFSSFEQGAKGDYGKCRCFAGDNLCYNPHMHIKLRRRWGH